MTSPDFWGTPGAPDPDRTPDPDHTPGRGGAPDPEGTPGPGGVPGAPSTDAPGTVDAPHCLDAPDAREGQSSDEAALRELMQQAVRDLTPAPGALDHLRRAVPARRQHRRQALAGSVAALLLVGAAVPALVHAAGSGGDTTASPAGSTHAHTSQPGEDGHLKTWGPTTAPGRDHGRDGDGSGRPSAGNGARNPSAHATSPSTAVPANAPACSGDQLGNGTGQADAPDAQGQVYGWFRVANVSGTACAMPPGTATVQVHLLSSTGDPSKITVVNHTAGDPADRLPAVQDTAPVVLAPGQAYEVDYAWVPGAAGPGGCTQPTSAPPSATATPTPTDTAASSGASGASAASAASAADEPADEVNAADSVPADTTPGGPASDPPSATTQPTDFTLLQNSTAEGPVVVGPTVENACAGTVYTTPPIARTPDVTAS